MTEAGSSGAPGSHSKSFDHSHYRPYQGGGGDSGDALSVTSVSSSGSDLEDVNASFLSDSPEGHERKVREERFKSQPILLVILRLLTSPPGSQSYASVACCVCVVTASVLPPDVDSFSETYRLRFGERSSSSRYNVNGNGIKAILL